MDISKKYIEMCERATELQKLIKFDKGTYDTWYGSYFWSHAVNNWFVASSKPREEYYSDLVWLPRQDQLQEMLNENQLAIVLYNGFYRLAAIKPYLTDTGYSSLKSGEQLWLAVIMFEKYGKVWDGKDWV